MVVGKPRSHAPHGNAVWMRRIQFLILGVWALIFCLGILYVGNGLQHWQGLGFSCGAWERG